MVDIRPKRSGSFLDPETWYLTAHAYGQRLWSVCKGRKGLFLTLTYKRSRYVDAGDLYHRQSNAEEKHIKCFMQRLQRRLRLSLTGKWVRKMEFQRGGWVHWHLIILDVERIESDVLAEAWGHGFVKVRKITKKRVLYTCKYVGKGGCSLPAWLYGERPRSVRIVQSSPGFWPDEDRKPSRYCPIYAKYGPPPPPRSPVYRPIGEALRQARGVTIRDRSAHITFSRRCDPAAFMLALGRRARCVGAVEGRWIRYDCDVRVAEDAAASLAARSGPSGGFQAPPRSGVNLSGTGERHGCDLEELRLATLKRQWWIEGALEEEALQQWRQEAWPDDARCEAAKAHEWN